MNEWMNWTRIYWKCWCWCWYSAENCRLQTSINLIKSHFTRAVWGLCFFILNTVLFNEFCLSAHHFLLWHRIKSTKMFSHELSNAVHIKNFSKSRFYLRLLQWSVLHDCAEFQVRCCVCRAGSVTCAWASLVRSWSMHRSILSLSFSPSSLSFSSSSFFRLSSLMPSSSFSLWLFNNWRKSVAPSTGCVETHKI